MAWGQEQAQRRIRKLIGEAPTIDVHRFSEEYMPLYEVRAAQLTAAGERIAPPLFDLTKGSAVLVDTVQIYIAITNYDEYRIEEDSETETSHERALRFLHLYYSACDRVAEVTPAQRVDFHGSRMHAVVIDRSGAGITRHSIADALAFVRDFRIVAERANSELARSALTARFRVGIDAGTCVAINNGTGIEQEPMFLGSAANYAAKLAEGDQPGIFPSDRVRALVGLEELGVLEFAHGLDEASIDQVIASRDEGGRAALPAFAHTASTESIVETWREEIVKAEVFDPTIPKFSFHHKEPPLSDIDYRDLSPSNSIRMPLISVFADLSGYTQYVDEAITSGRIGEAIRALYVIREELQNVVEEDFDGRKVRFIGDCIHALLAEGTRSETDDRKSVIQSFECAGGLRSSFLICQEELTGLEALGLTIGIEYGWTPVSRIGIRGVRSVRLASSGATATSEQMQRDCGDNEVKFGPNAMTHIPDAYHDLTNASGVAAALTYDDVVLCFAPQTAPATTRRHVRAHTPADGTVARAHFKTI